MRGDFLNRFLSLDRFQRDSRLHVCAEAPPLPRFHSAPFRGSRFYTLFTGPNFGEQLNSAGVAAGIDELKLRQIIAAVDKKRNRTTQNCSTDWHAVTAEKSL